MRLGSGRNQAPIRSRSAVGGTARDRNHYVAPSVTDAQRHALLIAAGVFIKRAFRPRQDQHALANMHNVAGDSAAV
jgi:hypothetical protein